MHFMINVCITFLSMIFLSNFGETTTVFHFFQLTPSAPGHILTASKAQFHLGFSCEKDSHCAYPRKCKDNSDPSLTKPCDETSPTSGLQDPFVCNYVEGFRACQSSTDCAHGDRCVSVNANVTESILRGTNACFSCRFAEELVTIRPDGYSNVDSEPESCKTYTGLWCKSDANCMPPRKCRDNSDSTLTKACDEANQASNLANPCVCAYPEGFKSCDAPSDCAFGDTCVRLSGNPTSTLDGNNVCLSCLFAGISIDFNSDKISLVDPDQNSCNVIFGRNSSTTALSATPTVEPTTGPDNVHTNDDGTDESNENGDSTSTGGENDENIDNNDDSSICVAVSSLTELHPSKLVYGIHRKGVVLCDSFDNCATPGHIVEYKGQAMMMKSYCRLLEDCVRRVKLVNSIRMEQGFRLESKAFDLKFTAFSARYESKLEEVMLRQIIQLGI